MSKGSFLGGYKVGINEANKKLEKEYQRGANDAWQLIKEMYEYNSEDLYAIFETHWIEDILAYNTPLEAMAKVKKYKLEASERFNIGDEVIALKNYIGFVSYVSLDGKSVDIVWADGSVSSNQDIEDIKKTGRHGKITVDLDEEYKDEARTLA